MTELTCIVCPKGCHLNVDEKNNFAVSGNSCPRGAEYGKKELTNPTRTLTSVVRIEHAMYRCCPVKTSCDIPKSMIPDAMALLKKITIQAPVRIGDVVTNIPGTEACWVVTKDFGD